MDKGTFAFKELKDLGTISSNGSYCKRLTVIKYGFGRTAKTKLDLRTWVEGEEADSLRMCKGLTLSLQEAQRLHELLGMALDSRELEDLLGTEEEGKEEA